MACDWVNQKVYWTSSGSITINSTVGVIDPTTKQSKILYSMDDGTQARGIVVDPLRG